MEMQEVRCTECGHVIESAVPAEELNSTGTKCADCNAEAAFEDVE